MAHGCSHIVVNDGAFRRVEGIQVLVLEDFLSS
jgi:hypothetical protein